MASLLLTRPQLHPFECTRLQHIAGAVRPGRLHPLDGGQDLQHAGQYNRNELPIGCAPLCR